jgi:hypothetical protein
MNPTKLLQQTFDRYTVDADFTDRVVEAAKPRPRRRVVLRAALAAVLVLCLVGTAAAASLGLLDRRLQNGEDNPLVSDERVPGYLAEHVRGDVVLEGTVEGLHLIYTNLLAENRFLYLEVLAEREDGRPIDAEALRDVMFVKYLSLSHYGAAELERHFPRDDVGWVGTSARIDDGTEPNFVHYAVALTLMRREGPVQTLTLDLIDADGWSLSSVRVPMMDRSSLRSARLPDGRRVWLGALGAEIQGPDFFQTRGSASASDFGVILRDGSRVCFHSNVDGSRYFGSEETDLWSAASFTQIIDPAEVVALFSPDGEYPVE